MVKNYNNSEFFVSSKCTGDKVIIVIILIWKSLCTCSFLLILLVIFHPQKRRIYSNKTRLDSSSASSRRTCLNVAVPTIQYWSVTLRPRRQLCSCSAKFSSMCHGCNDIIIYKCEIFWVQTLRNSADKYYIALILNILRNNGILGALYVWYSLPKCWEYFKEGTYVLTATFIFKVVGTCRKKSGLCSSGSFRGRLVEIQYYRFAQ